MIQAGKTRDTTGIHARIRSERFLFFLSNIDSIAIRDPRIGGCHCFEKRDL